MIVLIFLVPILTYLFMRVFKAFGWTTTNFEGKDIPYSLGLIVVFSFIVFSLVAPIENQASSLYSFLFITCIWFIGFIDDRFGDLGPKGLHGHFKYLLKEGKVSTGLLKVVGTVGVSFFYLFVYLQPATIAEGVRYAALLILTPHIMNLFDTRPLRVWKITLLHSFLFLSFIDLLPFSFTVFLLTVFFVLYVFEGHQLAMLGDNGATSIGAVLALLTILYTDVQVQWSAVAVYALLTIIAEKSSFSYWIEKTPLLKRLDRWGLS
ncbi:hypothetical protein [Desertibacillus haloalkaliphilus]|uniref:hypothetical protein n=1 Tax=Desertibacillus haloalkaliphilus TaxID=1328930 RepID=UPI001C25FDF1|nr:hypothetical protein [Desertibacillus haloalkaliphilus]MBU8907748.1 hypothetical protein [Desertibacillus haloalkaliphilus]